MQYATIESIEEGINEIKLMIQEILVQESFFLKKNDIECVKKGRQDFEEGRTISGETLGRMIE